MSFRSLGFYIRSGLQNILRNRVMSLASITAIMVALFVLGLVLVIAANLDVMVEAWNQNGDNYIFKGWYYPQPAPHYREQHKKLGRGLRYCICIKTGSPD